MKKTKENITGNTGTKYTVVDIEKLLELLKWYRDGCQCGGMREGDGKTVISLALTVKSSKTSNYYINIKPLKWAFKRT